MVVAFEAEMNVVMYADEGDGHASCSPTRTSASRSPTAGPGIPDLELAMQEGWSTATDEMREMGFGFGMGLPNIRKNSDQLRHPLRGRAGARVVIATIRLDGDG